MKSDMAIDALYIGPTGSNQYAPLFQETEGISTTDLLYPNPSTGIFTFETPGRVNASVEVLNQSGMVIWRAGKDDSKHQIDLSNQPVGCYFLRYKTAEKTAVKKLMINR
jgi:hypothetical protein